MIALRELQKSFRDYLVATHADELPALGIEPGFETNASLYRNNVRSAHVGTLAAIFPAVQALVGEDYFDGLATQFARSFPPRGAVLASYGIGFPSYVASRPELRHVPFLPDVAQLEWVMNEAFHAHSSFSPTPEEAARILAHAEGELRLALRPSVRLLAASAPVREIRLAALAGDAEAIQCLDETEQFLLIFRPAGEVAVERIAAGEFTFLFVLATKGTVDAAVAAAMTRESAFSPTDAVGRLLHLGVFQTPNPSGKGT
jgi:hypothetical protein